MLNKDLERRPFCSLLRDGCWRGTLLTMCLKISTEVFVQSFQLVSFAIPGFFYAMLSITTAVRNRKSPQ